MFAQWFKSLIDSIRDPKVWHAVHVPWYCQCLRYHRHRANFSFTMWWCCCFFLKPVVNIRIEYDYIIFYFNLIVMWYLRVTSIFNITRHSHQKQLQTHIQRTMSIKFYFSLPFFIKKKPIIILFHLDSPDTHNDFIFLFLYQTCVLILCARLIHAVNERDGL